MILPGDATPKPDEIFGKDKGEFRQARRYGLVLNPLAPLFW
jgi:hypothetical protein